MYNFPTKIHILFTKIKLVYIQFKMSPDDKQILQAHCLRRPCQISGMDMSVACMDITIAKSESQKLKNYLDDFDDEAEWYREGYQMPGWWEGR